MNRHLTKKYVKWTYDYSALPYSTTFAAADINETADTITIASHPFETGDLVALVLTPSTGVTSTVPALSTAYYVIKVDANTVQLATSQANAYAGTEAALTAGSAADCYLVKNAFGTVYMDGIQIPSGAIVTDGFIDVKTTFTSSDGSNDDKATLAFSSGVGAADLHAAVAIETGTTWDANATYGLLPGSPAVGSDATTLANGTSALYQVAMGATLVEVGTAAVTPSMAIAVDPLTAGKLDVIIGYIS